MIHTRTSVISSLQENKLSNSRNRKNNYRTCLDAEYKHFYQVYQRAPQGKATSSAASALLSHLDEKQKIVGPRLSGTSTSHTPVCWHGI